MTDFLSRVEIAEKRDISRNTTPSSSRRAATPTGSRGPKPAAAGEPAAKKMKAAVPEAKGATPVKTSMKAAIPKKGDTPAKTAAKEPAKKPDKAASTKPPTTAQLKEYGFKVLGPIAAGAFSTIIRAQHIESKTEVAVKTFAKCTGPEAEEHERELSVLRLIAETRHAHIANLIAEYEVPNLGLCAMLFYCSQGSLKAHLGKLAKKQKAMGEESAVTVVAQVASALSFLHANGVAHRDLKPGNILHDGRRWRLCDFGFAVVSHDKPLKKSCGTLVYSAPELLFGGGGSGAELSYIGHSVDLWAFGCVLYEMVRTRARAEGQKQRRQKQRRQKQRRQKQRRQKQLTQCAAALPPLLLQPALAATSIATLAHLT